MASVRVSCRAQPSLPCDEARRILPVPPDGTEVAVAAAVPDGGPAGAESTDVGAAAGTT